MNNNDSQGNPMMNNAIFMGRIGDLEDVKKPSRFRRKAEISPTKRTVQSVRCKITIFHQEKCEFTA
jgi:hypothetical protein